MRIGFIGGYGAHNIGDDLILHMVRTELQQRLACEVVGLTYARKRTVPGSGLVSLQQDLTPDFWRQFDAVSFGPGGVMPGVALQLADCLPPEDVRLVAVSCGYFPALREEDRERHAEATRRVLQRCAFVWSRDDLLPEFATGEVLQAPDCAYGLDATPAATKGRRVVLCPKGIYPDAGREALATLARQALAAGHEVLFFPASAGQSEMDVLECVRLAEETGGVCCLDVPNWLEAVDVFAGAALVAGFRKHAAILAEVLGVPAMICDYWGSFAPLQRVAQGGALIEGAAGEIGAWWHFDEMLLVAEARVCDMTAARQQVRAAFDALAEALR